jgi:transcriptional regulator with XRE-family HTH domain
VSYDLGRRLRNLRKSHHRSQDDLARAIERSPAYVSLLERGGSPTIADVLAIADALDVRPSELLGGVLDTPAAR